MPNKKTEYVLLTGSDLGERSENLRFASEQISQLIGKVIRRSNVHESEPWGFESDTKFLNQALLVESELSPAKVLDAILLIEKNMGRERNSNRWTSRTIDIDIICSENLIIQTDDLTIPHKHLHVREFVLEPVSEIAANWVHPVLQATCADLLSALRNVAPQTVI